MSAVKYKITSRYKNITTGEYEDDIKYITIPAFPGRYKIKIRATYLNAELYEYYDPELYGSFSPEEGVYISPDIVVGKERKTYRIRFHDYHTGKRDSISTCDFTTPSLALEDLTWAEIAKISEAGKAKEVFSIGDKKSLGNGFGSAVIIGFDHDDLTDGSGKAGITFAIDTAVGNSALKALIPSLSNPTMMNSTNTNTGGWGESRMLDQTMSSLGSVSPFRSFLSKIKFVDKAYVVPNNFPSTCDVETAYSRFFLFSCVEVDEGYSETAGILPYKDEGTIYEYWKTNKPVGRLRTAYPNGTFFRIDAAGAMQQSNASDTAYPIQFGFCI